MFQRVEEKEKDLYHKCNDRDSQGREDQDYWRIDYDLV